MLRFFSKFQRSSKLVLLLFCAVLLIGLIVFYAVPNQPLGPNKLGVNTDDSVVVAKVSGNEVTLGEYRKQLLQLAQMYSRGGSVDGKFIKNLGLDKQVLDRLIEDKLILSEAKALGFTGTDQEISDAITRAFTDPDTGKFIGKEEYLRALRLRGEDPEVYENNLRANFVTAKMRNFLQAGAQVSDKEIEEEFRNNGTKVEVVYATIDKDKIKDKPKPSDQELHAYYDAHKDEFKATDPVRKVEYIFIPTDKVTVNVTDEQLKAEYDKVKDKQKEPRASIIKLNVLTPADEDTVRAKINDLNRRVRGSDKEKGEDFAAVAKGNSQDPSAANGGDIGFIKKNPNAKNDWKQRVVGLPKDTIEGPFREGNSWYIMKVTEEREIPFAEMKPTLVAGAKNRSAYQKANEIADKAYELFTENKDLRKTAETLATEMKVKPEDLIRTTPYFKKGDTVPEIGSNPTFEGAVESLKKGEIGDKVGIPNGIAVPRVVDVIEGGVQLNFEQAQGQIASKLGNEKELNAAQQKANEILANAKTADAFKAALAKEGIEVKTDANNLTGLPFANLQTSQQVQAAVLATKQNEVGKMPIKTGVGTYLIFAATKRTDADMTKLTDAERKSLRQRLISEKGSLLMDAHLKDARKRLEAEKKIWVDDARINKFLDSLTSNQQAQ